MPHTAGTTIAEGDYEKLVSLLGAAFDGTAQRGSKLPILYGEFGVETVIPSAKAGAYSGVEPPSSGTVDEDTQARYYEEALKLALCQPNVIGILVFHVVDERALAAWQSGPFYADGTPKSSFDAIHQAVNAARAGTLASCPDRKPPSVSISGPTPDGTVTGLASDDIGVGQVQLLANDIVVGVKYSAPYTFAWKPSQEGRYTLELRATDAAGNVGRASVTVAAVRAAGGKASHAHLRWLNPFPANLGDVLKSYDRVLIPEMNMGQLLQLIRARYLVDAVGYNRVTGKPLKAADIRDAIQAML